MARDKREDAGEAGGLTAKEQVLTIYPEAKCVKVRVKRCGISYVIKIGDFDVLAIGTSTNKAWKGAWRCTQVRMVKQLEQ